MPRRRGPARRRKRPRRIAPAGVSAADVLLAVQDLKPTDGVTLEQILKMLGMERLPPGSPGVGTWQANVAAPDAPAPPTDADRAAAPPPLTPHLPPRLPGAAASARLVGRVTFAAPQWGSGNTPFKPAAGQSDSEPPPPIFASGTSRALLAAALSTMREGSELDVDRATDVMATRRWLDSIPYRRVPTLRRGAQVLIDESDAMNPFRHDVDHLLHVLDRLFGRGHLTVRRFRYCPGRDVWEAATSERQAWQPPTRGAPVVVVSDVGLTTSLDLDSASVPEWQAFAGRVRESACPLVALTPIGPPWPLALARATAFVHWSERTTARQIARALREAHDRLPEAR
jgi:hypothetical protein